VHHSLHHKRGGELTAWLVEPEVLTPPTVISEGHDWAYWAHNGATSQIASLRGEWADMTRRVGWLSLDDDDSDLSRFLTHVVLALQATNPDVGGDAVALLASDRGFSTEEVLVNLVNERATPHCRCTASTRRGGFALSTLRCTGGRAQLSYRDERFERATRRRPSTCRRGTAVPGGSRSRQRRAGRRRWGGRAMCSMNACWTAKRTSIDFVVTRRRARRKRRNSRTRNRFGGGRSRGCRRSRTIRSRRRGRAARRRRSPL
jgi:hypothetical protein